MVAPGVAAQAAGCCDLDLAARKPKSIWSNRLVLPGFDAIDHAKFDSEAKIEAVSETNSLRTRHLEGAVLIGATLRKADFTAAQLQGARLDGSNLRGAKFDCATLESVQGVSVFMAQQCAQLEGASLNQAQLQGASLNYAQLQGASLSGAELQGAVLDGSNLRGAKFDCVEFASLQDVDMTLAFEQCAQLQGASLNQVQLQGASLDGAKLQGASLDRAQLQGASLKGAQLRGASLAEAFVWRADAREAVWEDTRVVDPETGPKQWSVESFEKLKQLIAEQVLEGENRRAAMERIEQLDPKKALEGEDEMADAWEDQADYSPTVDVYEKRLAGIWRETGCAAEGAPYVLRRLLIHWKTWSSLFETESSPFGEGSPQPPALAAAFLDEEHCAGAHGLSDAEKAKLKEIRDRSPPPAPKP